MADYENDQIGMNKTQNLNFNYLQIYVYKKKLFIKKNVK